MQFDVKNRKTFLRRCLPERSQIVPELLRPGATITVLSRQLQILAYGDNHTSSQLGTKQERCSPPSSPWQEPGRCCKHGFSHNLFAGHLLWSSQMPSIKWGTSCNSSTQPVSSSGIFGLLNYTACIFLCQWGESSPNAHTAQTFGAEAILGFSELRMCLLSREEAERFYSVHRKQPFFMRLIDFMTSGRIVAIELLSQGIALNWRR